MGKNNFLMSILSHDSILKEIKLGNIEISPFNKDQLNPNSYNLKLSDEILIYTESILDPKKNNNFKSFTIPKSGILLEPGRLYLGRTFEYTKTKDLVPILSGRSSTGRLGISVHATAGFGDNGFSGYWTLEIFCVQPVILYPMMEVCQIYYQRLEKQKGENNIYRGKYQNNQSVQESMLFRDFK